MGRVTWNYLINHRLTPHQCAPNLFRVLGSVDALNEQMGLGLTWHDVVHMYKCHKLTVTRYYLKSQSTIVRLISCLPKSNKGMKDDYLIASREWNNGLHCPTGRESQVGYPRFRSLDKGFRSFSFTNFTFQQFVFFRRLVLLIWPWFAPWMFLQIKSTWLLGLVLSTSQVSTRCCGLRSLWVKAGNCELST